jgi:hypothetical protein
MTITYTSSSGESFDLMTFRLPRIMEANFHTFSWEPEVSARRFGEKVEKWKKEALTMSAVILFAGSPSDRRKALNTFHSAIDGDFFRNQPGILKWQDSYIKCFIRSSSTYPSEEGNRTLNDIQIYCPNPFWIQEQTLEIEPLGDIEVLPTDKQYTSSAYGYPHSYTRVADLPQMIVDHYADCDFRLVAYGAASEISISIGGHVYAVDHAVQAGEQLVIDSRQDQAADRHCYLVGTDGSITNCFNDRDPSSSLLQKIKAGVNQISYTRGYKIALTIFKERSEPLWTS